MDKQYKEWLQDQTFETLATDNYNVKLLLLAEQAKNKELENTLNQERGKVYDENGNCFKNGGYCDIEDCPSTMCFYAENHRLKAKNKKLVEALESIWTNTTFGTLNNLYSQSENLTYTELDKLLRPYIQSLHECASVYKQALNEVNNNNLEIIICDDFSNNKKEIDLKYPSPMQWRVNNAK